MESLARQLQNSEKEIQRLAQQLQNAIAMATEEAAKSRAAKEVIKSLTAQVEFNTNFQVLKFSCSLQVGLGVYCAIRLQPRTGV